MLCRRFLRVVVVLLAAFTTAFGAAAKQPAQRPPAATSQHVQVPLPPPSEQVPVDPAITVGRLDNGLRYYIRANSRPQDRAELRLVVNAGSVLEDNDQLGLAHVVEHMAFNGTTHFAKNDIGAFMESLGMRFGPSLNAFTSFDDTTYVLEVPTNQSGVMERAFLIMEDWAHNLTFDPVEVDKERGVIIEEWRQRRGASARMQDTVFPILLTGSRYADRSPIGTKESIESFSLDRLKQFYKDWYRPDLMAVIAVGDFDPVTIEALVRTHFGPLPAPATPRPRPIITVPDQAGTLFAITKDKEVTGASVGVYTKLPVREQSTVLSYRQRTIDNLYAGMFNARLSDISQKADPPFMAAGVSRNIFVRSIDTAMLSAVTKPDGIERALDALLTEAARVSQHGFTATELEREKRDLLRQYEQATTEVTKQESTPLAEEYIRAFLLGESIPGIRWEYEQHQRFLPGVTLAEVNAEAREWHSEKNRVLVVSAPDQPGLTVPTQARLAAVIAAVPGKKVEPYVDAAASAVLLDTLPAPGAIARATTINEIGVTEWELSNGVTVVLKPTTFKQDEVVFRATSPGGTSLASDRNYVAAMTASQVVSAGGVGAFDQTGLRKVLTGKLASVAPMIGETSEGLAGGGSMKDIETIFQLIYLYVTQPRADATVFGVMTDQMKGLLANRSAMPEIVFEDTVQTTLAQNHVRARPMSPELIDEMNLDASVAFYKDRFADASNFTFVFAGSFDVDTIRPFVVRYLGALPSLRRHETWKDTGITPPRGVITKTVEKGIEPQSRARIVFAGPFQFTPQSRVNMRAMGMMLEGRLGQVLREDQSGTYGVQVTSESQKIPDSEYQVAIDFTCAPERLEELVRMVFDEIARFRADGPTVSEVGDIGRALMREYETNSRENRYVVSDLVSRIELGEDLRGILQTPDLYRRLSTSDIRDAARAYLDPANYVRVTLVPEKKK